MSAVNKTMKMGQNPAKEFTENFFGVNECGEDCVEQNIEQKQNNELSVQGVADMFKFADTEVVSKIVQIIKEIDIVQIKNLILLGAQMFETNENGDVFLNLHIKIKDGAS